MVEVLLNGVTLDVLGLTAFAATVHLLVGRPKRRRLRVVAGVRCWCKAFGGKRTDCYCVSFETNESEQDGVK